MTPRSPSRRSRLILGSLVLAFTLLPLCAPLEIAHAENTSSLEQLETKMRANDFRLRVQATLLLGKSNDPAALPPLLVALDDPSAAVRAAAAVALKVMDDPVALVALEKKRTDPNASVRGQVGRAITSLERSQARMVVERKGAQVLVKLESVRGQSRTLPPELLGAMTVASRAAFRKLEGIALLTPSEDPEAMQRVFGRPVVVVRGFVQAIEREAVEANSVTANVEFLVHSHPDRALVGRLSGHASARGDMRTLKAQREVEAAALDAAAESAIGRGRTALLSSGRSG